MACLPSYFCTLDTVLFLILYRPAYNPAWPPCILSCLLFCPSDLQTRARKLRARTSASIEPLQPGSDRVNPWTNNSGLCLRFQDAAVQIVEVELYIDWEELGGLYIDLSDVYDRTS